MKKCYLLFLVLLTLPAIPAFSGDHGLSFIENKNQWEPVVQYRADIPGGAVYITDQGFTYTFYSIADANLAHEKRHQNASMEEVNNTIVHGHAYRVNFVNADASPSYTPSGKKITYYNYFIGNDPSKWAGHVPAYGKIVQHNIYAGIDAAIYSEGNSMKYDFIVAAGANPAQVILNFDGVTPEITPSGTLKIVTTVNEIEESAPYAYQWVNGQKVQVACTYKKLANGNIAYDFPNGYDSRRALVIDPTQVFGTFSGSTGNTYGFSACYDGTGALYAGGETFTTGWPASTGAFQTTFGGGIDCGLNKYSSDGTTLIFGTYFGGNGSDMPNNMITNSNNELAVMGTTTSSNLPVSTGCFQSTAGGGNDFHVVHFSADGSALIGATYVGGSGSDAANAGTSNNYGDQNRGELFIDEDGNIIVAGSSSSSNFPTTPDAYQPNNAGAQDGVIFKLNADCSQLLYSTYIGGSAADACFALVVNANNEVVACGGTLSADFPTTSGAMFETLQGQTDGFALILNFNTGLVHSTYLGTTAYDHAFKIQLDGNEDVLVMGQTQGNYPISSGVYAISGGNIFIDKLQGDLSASIASTRLGTPQSPSGGGFVPTAFLYDNCNNTYLCGFQSSNQLPVTTNAFQSTGNGFWFCTLDPDWLNLSYASYYGNSDHVDGGSSRFDPQGIIYHSVCTIDATFPTTPNAYAPNILASGWDVASFKFNFEANSLQANIAINTSSNDSGCAPLTVTFDNLTTGALTYFWDFGDGTTSTDFAPTHTFTEEGVYNVMLAVSNPNSCNTDDTAYYPIHVFKADIPQIVVNDTSVCDLSQIITLTASVPNLSDDMVITWSPAAAIVSDPNQLSVQVDPSISQTFQIKVVDYAGDGMCVDSSFDFINITLAPLAINLLNNDTIVCYGTDIALYTEGTQTNSYMYSSNDPDNIIWTPNSQNTFATVNEAAFFKVTVQDNRGCIGEDSVYIDLYPANFSHITPADSGVCPGDSLQYTVTGGGTYLWVPGTYLSDSTSSNPVATPANSIDYTVYVTTDAGCVDSQKVHLALYPNAMISLPDSVSLYPEEAYQMDPQGNCTYFQWFPPSGLSADNISNPIAQPDVRTRYFVTGTTEYGCTVQDSIDILVWETLLDMPNAFVPGNGQNNLFKPVRRGIAKLNSFTIYNRWGNKVYESTDIEQGWDGTYNGTPQPLGVYIYIIDAVKDNGAPFKQQGNVTLIR